MILVCIIYNIFCAGILLSIDDGRSWKFQDYLLFIFAGFCVPLIIGFYIGKKLVKSKVFEENYNK